MLAADAVGLFSYFFSRLSFLFFLSGKGGWYDDAG